MHLLALGQHRRPLPPQDVAAIDDEIVAGDEARRVAGKIDRGMGNVVFAGHVNNALTKSGVFGHLSQVHLGDYITVSDASGKALMYKVKAVDEYPADQAPADSIFSSTGPSQLILITCDGDWVSSQKSFDKRLVITATPVL